MEQLLNERYTPLQRRLVDFVDETLKAMEALSAAKLDLHAMAMLYMAVDTLATAEAGKTSGQAFIQFMDTYVIPVSTEGELTPFENGLDGARGIDLYAARCGLLHAKTADAHLVEQGKARRVFYAGSGQIAQDVRDRIKQQGVDAIVVIMNELGHAFLIGAHNFIDNVAEDPAIAERVRQRSNMWLSYEGPPRPGIEVPHEPDR